MLAPGGDLRARRILGSKKKIKMPGHINYQPSFRGALHARDLQEEGQQRIVAAGEAVDGVDPSPLIGGGGDRITEDGAGGHDGLGSPPFLDDRGGGNIPPSLSPSPFSSTRSYFSDLSDRFGWKFLVWLAVDNCLVSGGVFALTTALCLPLFKELGIDASRQQLYQSLIFSPWAMKPFIGVASDLFPVGGYNKRYLAVFSIVVGVVGCSVLLGVYGSGGDSAEAAEEGGAGSAAAFADVVVACFSLVSFEAATLDILGEGKYSELMRKHPESGSSIVSYKFGWALLGGMVTTSCVGPLADAGYFRSLFWMSLFLSLGPLPPTLLGWIPEGRRTADEDGMVEACPPRRGCCSRRGDGEDSRRSSPCLLFDRGTYEEKKVPLAVIASCGLAAPVLAAVTTYASLAVGLAVSALLIAAFMA